MEMRFESEQQAFDTAVRGVLAQGGRAVDRDGIHCTLRDAAGRRCAIGHLFPPELLERAEIATLAGVSPRRLWEELMGLGVLTPSVSLAFLADLQHAHDRADPENFVQDFIRLAQRVAEAHGLSAAALVEVATCLPPDAAAR